MFFFQNSDFGLKIIDFGLAKNLGDSEAIKVEKLQGTIGKIIKGYQGKGIFQLLILNFI